jgi:CheY-like chemotaxis protein
VKQIFLVEDNPDNRDLFEAFVAHLYDVKAVESGIDALQCLQSITPPDLFVFDISLPDMDGVELLREVKKIPTLQSIPSIAMTSHAMKGDQERFLAAGFNAYVSKPIVDETSMLDIINSQF